jgi:transcriptional regulator with XRE-family HTH domain
MEDSVGPFAQWLSATMRAHSLSQADVARRLGVADAQVSRWRRGQVVPSPRYLHHIATTFSVPVTTVEQLTGYRTPASESHPEPDPASQAEEQAILQGLAEILRQKVPRGLWSVYAQGCAVLAEEMTAAFEHALETGQAEHHPIGFHLRDE